jgi:hypothetical protein
MSFPLSCVMLFRLRMMVNALFFCDRWFLYIVIIISDCIAMCTPVWRLIRRN